MKKLVIFWLLLLMPAICGAQAGFINFEKTNAWIGSFRLNGQPVKHRFVYFIAGESSVAIDTVAADCACSVTKFTNGELAPAEYGYVDVTFNPYKPGPFEKKFTVTAKNGIPRTTELVIEGYIEPEGVAAEVIYPVTFGDFRFKSRRIFLGAVTNQAPVKKVVNLYNHTDRDISLSDSVAGPGHIEVIFPGSSMVPAKSTGSFILYYHPELKNDFGVVLDNLQFYEETGEDRKILKPAFQIDVSASIRQYFSPEETLIATTMPELRVDTDKKNLGDIDLRKEHEVSFVLYNHGQTDLHIQKVVSNYGCRVKELGSYIISPQQKATLIMVIEDVGKKGDQDRSVIIFCNDPASPTKKLVVEMDARYIN